MKVTNAKVYDLAGAIVGSGLPMSVNMSSEDFERQSEALDVYLKHPDILEKDKDFSDMHKEAIERHLRRARRLASCKGGESHDCFLCGILVSANIKAPKKWWEEFQRYHFNEIVSASSTMHKAGPIVVQPNLDEMFEESILKEPELKAFFERKKREYEDNKNNKEWLDALRFCLPLGTYQTARVTMNYRSLKTMYHQRHNHPLKEWRDFCEWIKTLPLSFDLIIGLNQD